MVVGSEWVAEGGGGGGERWRGSTIPSFLFAVWSALPSNWILGAQSVFMSSMKCKKSMNVRLFSCSAVLKVILAVMCIYVIYKCLSWDFYQQQEVLASQAKNSQAKPSV